MDFNESNQPLNSADNAFKPAESASSESSFVSAESSVSSEASSASFDASSVSSEASQTSSAADVPTEDKPLKERTETKDVNSKIRQVSIVEKDGTKVEITINAPKLSDTPEIDDSRFDIKSVDGQTVSKPNTKDFYNHLFKLVSAAYVTKDGQRTREQFGWDFFDKHPFETYRFLMDAIATFYNGVTE